MSEKDDLKNRPEVESLNERIVDADELNADELEGVSGGQATDCGTFSCGTFSGSADN
jgi:hypothetical protein